MSTQLFRARLSMAVYVALMFLWAFASTLARADEAQIARWVAHDGRTRPLVAVVGENAGTELTDFVVPYGVLARSQAADVVALSTRTGELAMRPALRISPQATIERFDAEHPGGADYVFVPAVVKRDDPALLAWLVGQEHKGATLISICDGALVLANAGLLKGRHATAHWATESHRREHYPETHWEKNVRFVVDGRIVSSAGISAAIPTAIALVEAIAGTERAAALAAELGVADWSTAHNSDAFQPRFGVNLMAYVRIRFSNARLHLTDRIGVPVVDGVDEIALAFTADAWSRTGRSQAVALASGSTVPIVTRGGLTVLPDAAASPTRTLPALGAVPSARSLDTALAAIATAYGRSTAFGVALGFEYPGFQR